MSTKTIKCYKITPSGDSRFDSLYVLAGDSWRAALDQVEASLEEQWNEQTPWTEIKVTVECVEVTPERWEELCNAE